MEVENYMVRAREIQTTNPDDWVVDNGDQLTLDEVCIKFGIDIINDGRNKVFWNINLTHKVLIDDAMFNYLGYSGQFRKNNENFRKLLKKYDSSIHYTEIDDDINPNKKYVVLAGSDFEFLLMHMRTDKSAELQATSV